MKKRELTSYIRVGIHYFKENYRVLKGVTCKELIPWSLQVIREDFPNRKEREKAIRKFNKFVVVPDNVNYCAEIDGGYNLYSQVSHIPSEGTCDTILMFVRHIFGEQYEMGLDYLELLYTQPKQKLPILLLVSKERATGKTTFTNFIADMFQSNVTFNTNESFRSPFNSDWASKLVIIVDEAFMNKRSDYEMIKNKSTAQSIKIELKGVERSEIPFFGKIIMCSNDEKCPIAIEKGENRFWVRKVPVIDKEVPDFIEQLQKEIPAFLYFLLNRTLSKPKCSRMWFNYEDIKTEALKKIISYNVCHSERDLFEFLYETMDDYNIDNLCFSISDIMPLLKRENISIESSEIKRILRMYDIQTTNSTYQTLRINKNGSISLTPKLKGRFYKVSKTMASEFV